MFKYSNQSYSYYQIIFDEEKGEIYLSVSKSISTFGSIFGSTKVQLIPFQLQTLNRR